MKKKIISLAMSLTMSFSMNTYLSYFVSADNTNLENIYSSKSISVEYENNERVFKTKFEYSDSFWFSDPTIMNTDIAKMSVDISAEAYGIGKNNDTTNISSTLKEMGFDDFNDHKSQWYFKDPTLENNDHVAYSFATKEIEYNNEKYIIYCIPVRGTFGNTEWFSNFNIGGDNDKEHLGFSKATDELYNELITSVSSDNYDSDHRIFYATGHSRGAAVTNMLAKRLDESNYAKPEHVFAYTFACPNVYCNEINDTYDNIYNFNNPGDMITVIPPEKWGFKRYGKTIDLDMKYFDEFKGKYNKLSKEEYKGLTDSSVYNNLIIKLASSKKDYNNNERVKSLMSVICYNIMDRQDISNWEYIKYLGLDSFNAIASLSDIVNAFSELSDIIDKSGSINNVTQTIYDAHGVLTYVNWINIMYNGNESILFKSEPQKSESFTDKFVNTCKTAYKTVSETGSSIYKKASGWLSSLL